MYGYIFGPINFNHSVYLLTYQISIKNCLTAISAVKQFQDFQFIFIVSYNTVFNTSLKALVDLLNIAFSSSLIDNSTTSRTPFSSTIDGTPVKISFRRIHQLNKQIQAIQLVRYSRQLLRYVQYSYQYHSKLLFTINDLISSITDFISNHI